MNVLFLAHRLPYAPNRGDRVRAFNILRELSRWSDVDVISLAHDADEAAHAGDLAGMTRSVTTVRAPRIRNALRAAVALPTQKPTTHSMLDGPGLAEAADRLAATHKPDVVFAYCTGVAPLALRPALRDVPLVLDMVDVDSAKWAALSNDAAPPMSWLYAREARLLRRFERDVCSQARVTFVVTEKEKNTLTAIAPSSRIEVIANGVDADGLRRPDGAETPGNTVVFCGVMNYEPNVAGVRWLAREVWPLVVRRVPDARLEIVGSHPTSAVRALADSGTGIVVTGSVPDVRPYLWRAHVSVAPLLTARGVQNKVLEAVAAGLPAVITPVVAEGLPAEVKTACSTAADAQSFATAIVGLLRRSPAERRAIARSAGIDALSWETRLAPLRRLLSEAVDQRAQASSNR